MISGGYILQDIIICQIEKFKTLMFFFLFFVIFQLILRSLGLFLLGLLGLGINGFTKPFSPGSA